MQNKHLKMIDRSIFRIVSRNDRNQRIHTTLQTGLDHFKINIPETIVNVKVIS